MFDDDKRIAINGSFPSDVADRYHYRADYADDRRKFEDGDLEINISLGDCEELSDDEQELVEDFMAWLLTKPVQRYL